MFVVATWELIRMELDEIGRVLSIPSRVHILNALMGGQALPAGELAYRAKVSNQTMSGHLGLLEKSGLLSVRKCGRHRYYELADENAALLLERLTEYIPRGNPSPNGRIPARMCDARFCYKHLAGRLGVALTERLVERKALRAHGRQYELDVKGAEIFAEVGLDIGTLPQGARTIARQCLDWTERRPHVAGSIGSRLTQLFLDLDWIGRRRDDRSAIVTDAGRAAFKNWLNVEI
jgi:DNA-binding transcriptional ArsR family regulator